LQSPNTQGLINIQSTELYFLENELANVGSRALAYVIDLIFKLIVVFATLWLFRDTLLESRNGRFITTVLLISFYTGYHVILEFLTAGKTPGKWLIGIRTLKTDGSRINILDSLSRNILRMVDFLPTCYITGSIVMFFERYNRRLGDIISNTIVIYDKPTSLSLKNYIKKRLEQSVVDKTINITGIEKLSPEEKSLAKQLLLRIDKMPKEKRKQILEKFHGKFKEKITMVSNNGQNSEPEKFLQEIVKRI